MHPYKNFNCMEIGDEIESILEFYRNKELAVHIPRFSTTHFLKEIRKNSINNFHFKPEKW